MAKQQVVIRKDEKSHTKIFDSKMTEEECINFANEIIQKNKWKEPVFV